MRDLRTLDAFRFGDQSERMMPGQPRSGGIFQLASQVDQQPLRIIATVGMGWEHVSVSRRDRCPTWDEMEQVKRVFFRPDETAMQLHVPESQHVNTHFFCLHIWRPVGRVIPRPPAWMV